MGYRRRLWHGDNAIASQRPGRENAKNLTALRRNSTDETERRGTRETSASCALNAQRCRQRTAVKTLEGNNLAPRARRKSETPGLVNIVEKVTPPKFSIRMLGTVSVLGSQRNSQNSWINRPAAD
jgi:hypothetical protein